MAESVLSKTLHASEKVAEVMPDMGRVKTVFSDAVEEGKDAARRAVKRSRHAAEELMEEAAHEVKRYPLQTVAITFGAAFAAGLVLGWLAGRRD